MLERVEGQVLGKQYVQVDLEYKVCTVVCITPHKRLLPFSLAGGCWLLWFQNFPAQTEAQECEISPF